jgi:tRNA dimethylallyltransferase
MSLNALKAIGYKQVYDAIITNKPIDVALIAQKTRNYAKRQIT